MDTKMSPNTNGRQKQQQQQQQQQRAADLKKDVVLVLQDESPFSVVFVPVQLNNERLLVQVQLTLF